MIDELVGARLVHIDDLGFTVIDTNNKMRHFEFDTDQGDCCGYADITTNLLISEEDLGNNPIITEVLKTDSIKKMRPKYLSDDNDELTITFIGEYKPIAEINSESSSGSGWCYGACAWVTCKETGEKEVLTSW